MYICISITIGTRESKEDESDSQMDKQAYDDVEYNSDL